jgi:hypothetical protein
MISIRKLSDGAAKLDQYFCVEEILITVHENITVETGEA